MLSRRIGLACALSMMLVSAQAQKLHEIERLKIGSLAGLARPEGFTVEDLRSPESKAKTPFTQTYKAPVHPFRRTLPLARYVRSIGDAELNVSPVDLLVEKLLERYGDRLAGKTLKVHAFAYSLEYAVNQPQGMVFVPLDPGAVAFAIVGTVAGTALMQGKGIDTKLRLNIEAELDGKRADAFDWPMTVVDDGAAERLTRFTIDKLLREFEAPAAEEKPAEEKPVEEKKTD